jgi:hypothetical protein
MADEALPLFCFTDNTGGSFMVGICCGIRIVGLYSCEIDFDSSAEKREKGVARSVGVSLFCVRSRKELGSAQCPFIHYDITACCLPLDEQRLQLGQLGVSTSDLVRNRINREKSTALN